MVQISRVPSATGTNILYLIKIASTTTTPIENNQQKWNEHKPNLP
jgi:hypothetical protein